jgi:hypothetical protein
VTQREEDQRRSGQGRKQGRED